MNRLPTSSEVLQTELRAAAEAYGVSIADATLDPEALQALATYGWKGATGYDAGTDLDERCRNAAQDRAKTLIG